MIRNRNSFELFNKNGELEFQEMAKAAGMYSNDENKKLFFSKCIDDHIAVVLHYLFNAYSYDFPVILFEEHFTFPALHTINSKHGFFDEEFFTESFHVKFRAFLNKSELINDKNQSALEILIKELFNKKKPLFFRIRMDEEKKFSIDEFMKEFASKVEESIFKNIHKKDFLTMPSPIELFLNPQPIESCLLFLKAMDDTDRIMIY